MKYALVFLLLFASIAHAQTINTTAIPLVSTAQTATTVNSVDQSNLVALGGHFVVNVSAFTSGTYTPHVQGKDPVSGAYYDILVGPAIGATGTTILKVYPGIGAIANAASPDILPLTWRVQLIGASTPSMMISVAVYLDL